MSEAPPPGPRGGPRGIRPFVICAVVMLAAIVGMRVADSQLEAQPLAAVLLSAVVFDLVVTRVGGELPQEQGLAGRLRAGLPFLGLGAGWAVVALGVAMVLGGGRVASVGLDVTSLVLGFARSMGLVARRQLVFALLPLLLVAGPGKRPLGTNGRRYEVGLCLFAAVITAELAYLDGDTKLSVLVQGAAALFGAAVLHSTRDLLRSVLAEGAVFFTIGTLFASVVDLRLGLAALSPIDRTESPYAVVLALGLVGSAASLPMLAARRERRETPAA